MAEATIIEAPPQPTSSKGAGSALPPSTGEIHVTPGGSLATTPTPSKGSAKESIFQNLRSRARVDGNSPAPTPQPPVPVAPKAEPAPAAEPVEEPTPEPDTPATFIGDDADEPTTPKAEPKPTTTPTAPTTPEPKAKVNPWKVVDEYKAKAAKLEQDLLEAKKLAGNEAERKAEVERLAQLDKRNKELENAIRFHDYTLSDEYKEKYEKPFNAAWDKAAKQLSQMVVMDEAGGERPATVNDIMDIVNTPSLSKAHELAKERFGDLASHVLERREEIVDLYEAQQNAIKEAKANGETIQKQKMEQVTRRREEITREITTNWEATNRAIAKDKRFGRFFSPTEGDAEGNARLEKGFKMVDETLSSNPMDPRLTSDQRRVLIEKQVAVRNRAAAFIRVARMVEQRDAEISELKAELAKYRGSEPEIGGGATTPAPIAPSSARESVMANLRKLAK